MCVHVVMYVRVQVFLLIEIAWPIFLFAILAGMRSKFPPEDQDTGECACKCLAYASVNSYPNKAIETQ